VVVASGRRLRPNAGLAELMEHDLVERGVPEIRSCGLPTTRIARWKKRKDLRDSQRKKMAQRNRGDSEFSHATRRYIIRRVFSQGLEVRVASARDGDFDPERWWQKRKFIKELTREFAGMVVAIWELRGRSETSETSQSVVGLGGLNPQLVV